MTKDKTVGSYQLSHLLGRGGMGEVWQAHHPMLDRKAAIKLILPDRCGATGARKIETIHRRFQREARATSTLKSPHTVQIYDFGTTPAGEFYYAMELLDGFDLQTLVERYGPISPGRVLHLLDQACDSLAEAHHNGLVHRDIKPANIFTCRMGLKCDFVKILDFGLVKSEIDEGETKLTREGMVAGSPTFMPPEAVDGTAFLDVRGDIYGLGCVAYWLLTGRLVFDGDTALQVILAHREAIPQMPSLRAPGPMPVELDELVLACLEKDRANRPQSIETLRSMLGNIPNNQPWTTEMAVHWWGCHQPEFSCVEASPKTDDVSPTWNGAATVDPDRIPKPLSAPLEIQREQAVARLRQAFDDSQVNLVELEERLALAANARVPAELEVLLQDLPAQHALVPRAPSQTHTAALVAAPLKLRTFFGATQRNGAWDVPPVIDARAYFGAIELDFREANLGPVTKVQCQAVFGAIQVTVPPGVTVRTEGVGIFGGFKEYNSVGKGEDAPQILISGKAIMGAVEVGNEPPKH